MIDRSFLPDPAMLALVTTGAWAYVAYLENDRLPVLIAAGLLTTIGVLAKLPGIAVVVPMTYATFVILHQRGRLSLGRLLVILGVALVAGALILGYYRWAHYLGTNYPPYHVAGSGYLWSDGFARFFEEAFYIPATWKIASSWLFTLPVVILTGIALLTAPPAANEGAPDDASASSARWFFHVWFLGPRSSMSSPRARSRPTPGTSISSMCRWRPLPGAASSCSSASAANRGCTPARYGLRPSPPSSSSAAASPACR